MANAKRLLAQLTAVSAAANVFETEQTKAAFEHIVIAAHDAGIALNEINQAIDSGAQAALLVAKGRKIAENF